MQVIVKKHISAILVLFFLLNDISWAMPENVNFNHSTIQVQSIFKPFTDVTGGVYDEAQLRIETAVLISAVLKDPGAPFFDINAILDKWYSNIPANYNPYKERQRILRVVNDPKIISDETSRTKYILIHVEVFRGEHQGKGFEIKWYGKNLNDLQTGSGIEIEQKIIDANSVKENSQEEVRPRGSPEIDKQIILEKDYSKSNARTPRAAVNINDVVRGLEPKLEEGHSSYVNFELDERLDKVEAPRAFVHAVKFGSLDGEPAKNIAEFYLKRILSSALLNAIYYADKDKGLKIKVKTFLTQNNEPALLISDTGPGIDFAKIRQKILAGFEKGLIPETSVDKERLIRGDKEYLISLLFEVLVSTKPHLIEIPLFGRDEPQGRGFGLKYEAMIMEASRGKIWVETRPGGGTTFTYIFEPIGSKGQYYIRKAAGRIGKLAYIRGSSLKFTGTDKEKAEVDVQDVLTGENLGAFELNKADGDILEEIFHKYEEWLPDEKNRKIVRRVLNLFEPVPPSFYVFVKSIKDLSGFSLPGHNLIALHGDLVNDRVALLHELMEYAVTEGRVSLSISQDKTKLYIRVNGFNRAMTLDIANTLKRLQNEEWSKWPADELNKKQHYLLRILLNRIHEKEDKVLTGKIQAFQGKGISLRDFGMDVAVPLIDKNGFEADYMMKLEGKVFVFRHLAQDKDAGGGVYSVRDFAAFHVTADGKEHFAGGICYTKTPGEKTAYTAQGKGYGSLEREMGYFPFFVKPAYQEQYYLGRILMSLAMKYMKNVDGITKYHYEGPNEPAKNTLINVHPRYLTHNDPDIRKGEKSGRVFGLVASRGQHQVIAPWLDVRSGSEEREDKLVSLGTLGVEKEIPYIDKWGFRADYAMKVKGKVFLLRHFAQTKTIYDDRARVRDFAVYELSGEGREKLIGWNYYYIPADDEKKAITDGDFPEHALWDRTYPFAFHVYHGYRKEYFVEDLLLSATVRYMRHEDKAEEYIFDEKAEDIDAVLSKIFPDNVTRDGGKRTGYLGWEVSKRVLGIIGKQCETIVLADWLGGKKETMVLGGKAPQIGNRAYAKADTFEYTKTDNSEATVKVYRSLPKHVSVSAKKARKIGGFLHTLKLARSDIDPLKEAREKIGKIRFREEKYERLVHEMFRFFEKRQAASAPGLFIYDAPAEDILDLFGFPLAEKRIIALHTDLIGNPVAIFHELAEYFLNNERRVNLKLNDDRTILKVDITGKEFDVDVSPAIKELGAEGEEWVDSHITTINDSTHLKLRILQRALFRDLDMDLTRKIRKLQGIEDIITLPDVSGGKKKEGPGQLELFTGQGGLAPGIKLETSKPKEKKEFIVDIKDGVYDAEMVHGNNDDDVRKLAEVMAGISYEALRTTRKKEGIDADVRKPAGEYYSHLKDNTAFFAVKGQKVIGYLTFDVGPQPEKTPELVDIAILPEERNKGLTRALMDNVIESFIDLPDFSGKFTVYPTEEMRGAVLLYLSNRGKHKNRKISWYLEDKEFRDHFEVSVLEYDFGQEAGKAMSGLRNGVYEAQKVIHGEWPVLQSLAFLMSELECAQYSCPDESKTHHLMFMESERFYNDLENNNVYVTVSGGKLTGFLRYSFPELSRTFEIKDIVIARGETGKTVLYRLLDSFIQFVLENTAERNRIFTFSAITQEEVSLIREYLASRAESVITPYPWCLGYVESGDLITVRLFTIAVKERTLDAVINGLEAGVYPARDICGQNTDIETALSQKLGEIEAAVLSGYNSSVDRRLAGEFTRLYSQVIDSDAVFVSITKDRSIAGFVEVISTDPGKVEVVLNVDNSSKSLSRTEGNKWVRTITGLLDKAVEKMMDEEIDSASFELNVIPGVMMRDVCKKYLYNRSEEKRYGFGWYLEWEGTVNVEGVDVVDVTVRRFPREMEDIGLKEFENSTDKGMDAERMAAALSIFRHGSGQYDLDVNMDSLFSSVQLYLNYVKMRGDDVESELALVKGAIGKIEDAIRELLPFREMLPREMFGKDEIKKCSDLLGSLDRQLFEVKDILDMIEKDSESKKFHDPKVVEGYHRLRETLQVSNAMLNKEVVFEKVRLKDILARAVDSITEKKGEHQYICEKINIEGLDDVVISGQATALKLAFERILSNMFHSRAGKIDITITVENDYAIIRIRDDAGGIDEDLINTRDPLNRQKVFWPGTTGRENGTGMGMNFLWHVAELHGGWGEALNYAGDNDKIGAEFKVYLPSKEKKLVMPDINNRIKNINSGMKPVFLKLKPYLETLEDSPVNIVVDTGIINEDQASSIDLLSCLILSCVEMPNVHFTFKKDGFFWNSVEQIDEEFSSKVMSEAAINARKYNIFLDAEKFKKERMNADRDKFNAIEITMVREKILKKGRDFGERLKPYQYPVALENDVRQSGEVFVPNFEAAFTIGLAQAALAIAYKKGDSEDLAFLMKYLPEKLEKIYKHCNADIHITDKTLENMIHPSSVVRLNLALDLVLPVSARMPIERLKELNDAMQLFMLSA